MRTQPTEHDEQAALIQWAFYKSGSISELALLFAIPNGGWRSPRTGARLKAEGVQPGVPDLCLPVARGPYHGLFIEMKTLKGKLSPEQKVWHAALREQGYRVEVCYGWEPATHTILIYLGVGEVR